MNSVPASTGFREAILRHSRRHPQIGAWIAALALSLVWTGIWVTIFLFSTLLLDLSTSVLILLVTLWLSVVAEAPIRYVENTDIVAAMSKVHEEHPQGDNQDYKSTRAVVYSILGLLPMGGFLIWWYLSGQTIDQIKDALGVINGPTPERGWDHTKDMFISWSNALREPVVWISIASCILMRALIYKRKVNSNLLRLRNSQLS